MTGVGLANRTARELGVAMGLADDAALLRVVAILDGLRHRGDADAALEQVRTRLRTLRPPRPLSFGRLLFLPLDGAILPPARWRRGEPALPRSALGVLAEAVRRGLGDRAAPLTTACEGNTTAATATIRRLGAALWPLAADALPPNAPADWPTTGLATADYPPLAALCRPLWAQGLSLWDACAAAEGPPEHLVEVALAPLLPAGPKPLAAALATLLAHASAPGRVLQVAARLDPQARPVALQALDAMLDQAMPDLDRLDIQGATEASLALALRLDDLARCSLLGTDRQRRVHALRHAAEEACRERFVAAA